MERDEPIKLRGVCDIRTSNERRAALLAAIAARDDVALDAAEVEHVDITFLQLLASAAKTAKASRKRLRLIAVSEPLRDALARAGFTHSSSDDQITWA